MTSWIILLLVFLLLFVFVVMYFFALAYADRQPIATPFTLVTGSFLNSCALEPCTNPFICDGSDYNCKLPLGATCSTGADCLYDAFCSGRCTTGPTGTLNDFCPCEVGFACVPQVDGFTRCKAEGNVPCTTDSDCVSIVCLPNNLCQGGFANGLPCQINDDCQSDNCAQGFCQPPGTITGELSSACFGNCVPFEVIAGAQCNPGLTCVCTGDSNTPGICTTTSNGILDSCAIAVPCGNLNQCLGPGGLACTAGTTGCLCVFPYTSVNEPPSNLDCLPGMGPAPGATGCFNNTGLGCNIGPDCRSTTCSGGSVLVNYRFDGLPGTPFFPGATGAQIERTVAGPTGLSMPYKMFATSSQRVDTIYLVDHSLGFLSLVYNAQTRNIVTPWTQLLPITSTTPTGQRTLIDVGTNGITFVVAFNETANGNNADTVYTWTPDGTLTPFNVTTGIPGTQFTTGNQALSINYLDISPPNPVSAGNDVLIVSGGTVHIKASNATQYSVGVINGGPMAGQSMTGVVGPVRFYFDNEQPGDNMNSPICPGNNSGDPILCPSINNIALVKDFTGFTLSGPPPTYPHVLQFSGNVAGASLPTDRFDVATMDRVDYEVFDYDIFSPVTGEIGGMMVGPGMQNSVIVLLTMARQGTTNLGMTVNLSYGGNTTPFPYRGGSNYRSVATANGFYIYSPASCG